VSINDRDEIVRLQNVSAESVSLDGWRMCSITGNQEHLGINGVLAPGETRDFPYQGTGSIWSNSENDDGALYNANGQLVSYRRD
jgi:micrococcal nuclease